MWYSTAILIVSCSLVKAQLTPSPSYAPPSAAQGTQASTGRPNSQWSTVLGNSLWFYDAQRSGRLEQGTYGNRVAWRNDSCLEDGNDYGVDLSGGWFDAGDYIKATFPLTFTLTALSWGALTHGRGYDSANQGAYLDGTLRWGFDWMMKAHPSDDVLFMQVGSSDVDNAYWGGDQNIPTPRPAYPVNSSSPGTDAWASAATAFAMGSILYSAQPNFTPTSASSPPISPSIDNATYSSQLLSHAEALYRTAKNTTPYTLYASSLPAIKGAYGSSDFGDDLSISALTLALATNQSSYYQDAYQFYQQFALSGTRDPWNWDSQKPALYVLFVEAALARPSLAQGAGLDTNLTGWRTEAENYFDRIINGNLPEVYITKAGLLYYEGDSRQASLNPAMAAATLMLKYAPMASTSEKGTSYTNFAQTQIDYLMGKNPMNAVYLVGSHPNSPQNPHSAPASGGTSLANLRTDPPVNERVLYGAMVGGPLSNDRYWDWRDDWVQNEVALDYNAMIPTLAAMQLLSNASDPFYVSLQAGTYSIPSGNPCDDALPCAHSLSGGAIAGIVLGCIAALLLVGLLWWIVRRRGIR